MRGAGLLRFAVCVRVHHGRVGERRGSEREQRTVRLVGIAAQVVQVNTRGRATRQKQGLGRGTWRWRAALPIASSAVRLPPRLSKQRAVHRPLHFPRLKPDYADALCDLGCTYCAQVGGRTAAVVACWLVWPCARMGLPACDRCSITLLARASQREHAHVALPPPRVPAAG